MWGLVGLSSRSRGRNPDDTALHADRSANLGPRRHNDVTFELRSIHGRTAVESYDCQDGSRVLCLLPAPAPHAGRGGNEQARWMDRRLQRGCFCRAGDFVGRSLSLQQQQSNPAASCIFCPACTRVGGATAERPSRTGGRNAGVFVARGIYFVG